MQAITGDAARIEGSEQGSDNRATHSSQHPKEEPQLASSWLEAALEDGDEVREERGTRFVTSGAFYRAESGQSRDLAVLLAMLHKQDTGQLRVLDAMSGP